jgi:DNA-binding CsgD family transcriptional regulator
VLEAVGAARVAGRFCPDGGRNVDLARLARELPLPAGVEATAPHLLLDGFVALHLEGHAVAVPILHRALAALAECDPDGEEALQWLGTGCWVAGAVADDDALYTLGARVVDAARRQGAIVQLTHGLLYLAMANLLRGSLGRSRSCFAERSALLATLGIDVDVGRMVVAGWGGPEASVRDEISHVTRVATERRQGWMLVFAEYARAILELGLGNYEVVVEHNDRRYDDDSFLAVVGFPNVIEAMARSGRRDDAEAALGVFAERTKVNATNLSLGLLARTRAILADDASADALYQEAITRLERSRAYLQLGRALLLYGEWLRRQQRPTEARVHLRAAYELFSDREAAVFAERARIELEATGERARQRTVDASSELTPQERQVATLAADGLTNAEIATKLFLSASTVDYHLRKVYRKMSIGSRRELGRALDAADRERRPRAPTTVSDA